MQIKILMKSTYGRFKDILGEKNSSEYEYHIHTERFIITALYWLSNVIQILRNCDHLYC